MIPSIIVEDEIHSANVLIRQIQRCGAAIQVLGVAENLPNAIRLIREKKPALVFMDIEIPGGNAFSILDTFDPCDFAIIFITAFEHYALKAIKYSALDYLLKPVSLSELTTAIEKARENLEQKTLRQKMDYFMRNLRASPDDQQIVITSKDGMQSILLNDIIYLEANGSYTVIHIEKSSPIVSSRHLKDYENMLPASRFFRIHHSYVVHKAKVVNVKKGKTTTIILTDNTALQVSVRRVADFMDFFTGMF